MNRIILLFFTFATLGLILGGCSSATDPAETSTNLEDFGSYKATDEEPNFGDPIIAELTAEEETYADPIAFTPIVTLVDGEDSPDKFCFRMAWGNLAGDSDITELTDWSGKLTVSRGAIVVTHLIKFEPEQDYLLPRYDSEGIYVPEVLQWMSFTSVHFDGIASCLYFPPSETEEVVTITYESAQLTISFTMDELYDLDTLVEIGTGNAISFQSVLCDPRSDTRGALMGRWSRDEEGNGIFYGRWISGDGSVIGSFEGEWGIDEDGAQVFVGKYIDDTGAFEGFIKGNYGRRGQGINAAGHFWGHIYNADGDPIGVLKGHYKQGDNRRNGYLAGRWCVGDDCFTIRN